MIADLLGIAALIAVLVAPLPLAAALASADDSDSGSPGHRLLHVAAWWWATQTLLLMLLGCAGWFALTPLLLGEAAVAAVGLVVAWRRRAAVAAWSSELDRALRARLAGDGGWSQRLLMAAGIAMVAVAAIALISIPTENYDSLMYQLPLVAEWVQDGSLHGHQQQWVGKATYEQGILWYPTNWNLLYLLAVLPLGHDQAVLVPNLLAWVVFGLAISGLARRLAPTAPAWTRHLLAAALMSAPQTVANLFSAHVDLAFASALLLGLYLALSAVPGRSGALALAALAVGGLALGSKLSAPAWLAALGAAVAVAAWRQRRATVGLHWRIAAHPLALALAVAVVVLCGAGWYLRNWWALGNPFGILRVELLGRVWFDGIIDRAFIARTSLAGTFPIASWWHWKLLGWAVLCFLGVAAGVLIVASHGLPGRLFRQRPPMLRTLLVLAAAWSWLYIAGPWSAKHAHESEITPWLWQQLRYTFAIWGLIAALAAATMPTPGRWLRWALLSAVVIGMAAVWWWRFPLHTPWALCGLFMALFVAGALLLALRLPALLTARPPACPGRRWARRLAVVAAVVGVVIVVRPLRDDLRQQLLPVASPLRGVDHRPVAFHGSHQSWLLYGPDLRRPVRYLAIDGSRDLDRDLDRALRRAVAAGCTIVAVGPTKLLTEEPTGTRVIDWLIAHPERARLIFGDPADPWRMVFFVLQPLPPTR